MTELSQIYQVYFSDVYRFLLRLSGDEQVAEALTSDTFFKAMRALDSFRGECELRVWLCQIAKRCYFSYLRQQGRADSLAEKSMDVLTSADPSAEEYFLRQEEASSARQACETLNEPYRTVFCMRALGDMSFRQIGNIFHKSENWACVTFHRAKKRIRAILEESEL